MRLVVDSVEGGARVVVDRGKDRKGRSAYLCKSEACLDRALRRKAFNRAFRATVGVDEELIRVAVAEAAVDRRAE